MAERACKLGALPDYEKLLGRRCDRPFGIARHGRCEMSRLSRRGSSCWSDSLLLQVVYSQRARSDLAVQLRL